MYLRIATLAGRIIRSAASVAACSILTAVAYSQTPLFDEVHTIAGPDSAVPVEHSFSIGVAGTYKVKLTDLGAALTPSAPLSSVKLAITDSSDTLVGTPLTQPGTSAAFHATPGSYVFHVVGAPGSVAGSGPIGVEVDASDGTPIATFSDTLAPATQALANGEAVLNDSFTVDTTGSYQVTLADLQLPQSLDVLTLAVTAQGSSSLVTTVTVTNGISQSAVVSLDQGVTYRIFAVGQAGAAVAGGLYAAAVTAVTGGAVAYSRAIPVGGVVLLGSPTLNAGSYSFHLSDIAFPAALTQLGAVLAANAQVAARLTTSGAQAFTAANGTYQAFALAVPDATAQDAGSYAVQVQTTAGATVFGSARAVTAPGSPLTAYSFDVNLAAGAFAVRATDFLFPLTLSSLHLATVQNGAALGTPLDAQGTLNITAAAGTLSLLAFAQAATPDQNGTAGGLFGLDVTASGAAVPVFATTQGIGALFSARQVSITTAGNYRVTAADVGFPASFASFDVVVTQGTSRVGTVFGAGSFIFAATPGNYFVNFIAQPTGTDNAGTYALKVAAAPAAPVVTLSSDATQAAAGNSVTLTWSSENATSCTASGGWSGTQALAGSAKTPAISATTTFTLSCDGAGGTTEQSVTVTVSAAAATHSGGGSFDPALLLALALVLITRAYALRKPSVSRQRLS